jgi:hypothetical protein
MATRIVIHHRVEQGDAWFEHFVREAGEEGNWQVERSPEDPDELIITQHFSSRADAEAALSRQELAEALRSAGVGEDSVRVEILD